MAHVVDVKEVEPVDVVGLKITTTPDSAGEAIGAAYHRIFAGLEREGIAPAGPPRLVYHEMDEQSWTLEPCVPVTGANGAPGGLTLHRQGGGRVVSAIHTGPYEKMGEAYAELEDWVKTHDLRLTGVPYDIYLSDPATVPPEEVETEIVWPVT